MAYNNRNNEHARVQDEEILFKILFKKNSSTKFLAIIAVCLLIPSILCLFLTPDYTFTISTAIILCLAYLVSDFTVTPEVQEKINLLTKTMKDNMLVKKSTFDTVAKQNQYQSNYIGELEKKFHLEKEKYEYLLNVIEREATKEKTLRTDKDLIIKSLAKSLDSERLVYKKWKNSKNTLKKKLEEEKKELEQKLEKQQEDYNELEKFVVREEEDKRKLEEEKKELERKLMKQQEDYNELEKFVVREEEDKRKLEEEKKDLGREIMGLQQDYNELFQVLVREKEEKNRLVKKGKEDEQKKVLEIEEKMEMVRKVTKLEVERDLLVQSSIDLQNKYDGIVKMLNEHVVTNGIRYEKLLENQESLLKLMNETMDQSDRVDDEESIEPKEMSHFDDIADNFFFEVVEEISD